LNAKKKKSTGKRPLPTTRSQSAPYSLEEDLARTLGRKPGIIITSSAARNPYDISTPAKADVHFPENMRLDELKGTHDPGKNYIWVTAADAPLRPATFTAKRVDLVCVVHVYTKAASGTKDDVLAANTRKQNMMDEVCDIIIANGPSIKDFHLHLKLFIDRSDIYFDPPILAADIHVQCTYLR